MLRRVVDFFRSLFSRRPVRLAIVRRYADANGSYVGELYIEQEQGGVSSYRMVGASLDSIPLHWGDMPASPIYDMLDTRNDFLAPMPPYTIRVGSIDPADNDRVRQMVARLPRRSMTLIIQNRFIEHVMDRKP